jgi:hypothetical protein
LKASTGTHFGNVRIVASSFNYFILSDFDEMSDRKVKGNRAFVSYNKSY